MNKTSTRHTLLQRLTLWVGALFGWRVVVPAELPSKCVIVGAHHTSSWDLPLTLLLRYGANLRFRWIAKAELFWGPVGWLWQRLGGIPVRRHARRNFVQQIVDVFDENEQLMVAISPEGTRSGTRHWKTGFYYIAQGAGVPIVLGYADYRRKEVGLGPAILPTGDIEADLEQFRAFYDGITARYPDKAAEIRLVDRPVKELPPVATPSGEETGETT